MLSHSLSIFFVQIRNYTIETFYVDTFFRIYIFVSPLLNTVFIQHSSFPSSAIVCTDDDDDDDDDDTNKTSSVGSKWKR